MIENLLACHQTTWLCAAPGRPAHAAEIMLLGDTWVCSSSPKALYSSAMGICFKLRPWCVA